MAARYGFAGMGQMGAAMASNMVQAGLAVTVYNRTASRCEELRAQGANVAVSVEELYSSADIIFNMLSTPEAAKEFYSGKVAAACTGKDVIDCATLGDATMIELAQLVTANGGRFLEAPVAGNSAQAKAKTIEFMCAGDRAVYERIAPAIAAMAKGAQYLGEEVGVASRMKLVVNSLLANLVASLGEALSLTEKAGLPQDALMALIANHPMGNDLFKLAGRLMMQGTHAPLFMAKHAEKDLGLALTLGATVGQAMPNTHATRGLFAEVLRNGDGEKHMTVVYETLKAKPL